MSSSTLSESCCCLFKSKCVFTLPIQCLAEIAIATADKSCKFCFSIVLKLLCFPAFAKILEERWEYALLVQPRILIWGGRFFFFVPNVLTPLAPLLLKLPVHTHTCLCAVVKGFGITGSSELSLVAVHLNWSVCVCV